MTDVWDIEFYADRTGYEPCRAWMDKLPEYQRIALAEALDLVLGAYGMAVVGTEWAKALGQGLYEFRLRWSADEVRHKVGLVSEGAAPRAGKILLRVFFCTSGKKVILLLSGYDKGKDDNSRRQAREIAKARKAMSTWREMQRKPGGGR